MAVINFSSVVGSRSLEEVIDSVENMRKEVEYVFANLDGDNFVAGNLNMGNKNIINVNSLQINDPGGAEGIQWMNGNGWKIVESPDDGGNNKGNIQFFLNGVRKATITTGGQIQLLGNTSLVKLIGTTHTYMEFMLNTTRSGWFGYGASGTDTMQIRNEQGDIVISPKITTNKVTASGIFSASSYADFAAGQTSVTPVADTPTSKVVSFGKTFASAPTVVAVGNTAVPGTTVTGIGVSDVTTTGFTVWVTRTNDTATLVNWVAVNA